MARLLVVSRSMALAMRLADAHEVIEHPVEDIEHLVPPSGVDVVVLDVGEPAAAIHALDRLRGGGHDTPALIVSGYQPAWASLVAIDVPDVVVVPLPITRAALLGGIAQLCRSAAERPPAVGGASPDSRSPAQPKGGGSSTWDPPAQSLPAATAPISTEQISAMLRAATAAESASTDEARGNRAPADDIATLDDRTGDDRIGDAGWRPDPDRHPPPAPTATGPLPFIPPVPASARGARALSSTLAPVAASIWAGARPTGPGFGADHGGSNEVTDPVDGPRDGSAEALPEAEPPEAVAGSDRSAAEATALQGHLDQPGPDWADLLAPHRPGAPTEPPPAPHRLLKPPSVLRRVVHPSGPSSGRARPDDSVTGLPDESAPPVEGPAASQAPPRLGPGVWIASAGRPGLAPEPLDDAPAPLEPPDPSVASESVRPFQPTVRPNVAGPRSGAEPGARTATADGELGVIVQPAPELSITRHGDRLSIDSRSGPESTDPLPSLPTDDQDVADPGPTAAPDPIASDRATRDVAPGDHHDEDLVQDGRDPLPLPLDHPAPTEAVDGSTPDDGADPGGADPGGADQVKARDPVEVEPADQDRPGERAEPTDLDATPDRGWAAQDFDWWRPLAGGSLHAHPLEDGRTPDPPIDVVDVRHGPAPDDSPDRPPAALAVELVEPCAVAFDPVELDPEPAAPVEYEALPVEPIPVVAVTGPSPGYVEPPDLAMAPDDDPITEAFEAPALIAASTPEEPGPDPAEPPTQPPAEPSPQLAEATALADDARPVEDPGGPAETAEVAGPADAPEPDRAVADLADDPHLGEAPDDPGPGHPPVQADGEEPPGHPAAPPWGTPTEPTRPATLLDRPPAAWRPQTTEPQHPGVAASAEPDEHQLAMAPAASLEDVAASIARRRAILGRSEHAMGGSALSKRLAGRTFETSLGPGGSSAELVALGLRGTGDDGRPARGPAAQDPHREPAAHQQPAWEQTGGQPEWDGSVWEQAVPEPPLVGPHGPATTTGHVSRGHSGGQDSVGDTAAAQPRTAQAGAYSPLSALPYAAGAGGDDHGQAPAAAPPARSTVVSLVSALTEQVAHVYGVADTAQVLADEVVERADADAAAILVPDGTVWRVSGGVGLRPLERRLVLDSTHWLVGEIAIEGRALLVEDTDIVRPKLVGAPLAAWRHLLAVPVPDVQAAVVLARGHEAGPFTEHDLAIIVGPVREAAVLLRAAIQARHLARLLSPLREQESGSQ